MSSNCWLVTLPEDCLAASLPADGVDSVADLAPRLVEGEGSEQSACLLDLHFVGSNAESMCLLGEESGSRCFERRRSSAGFHASSDIGGHIRRRWGRCQEWWLGESTAQVRLHLLRDHRAVHRTLVARLPRRRLVEIGCRIVRLWPLPPGRSWLRSAPPPWPLPQRRLTASPVRFVCGEGRPGRPPHECRSPRMWQTGRGHFPGRPLESLCTHREEQALLTVGYPATRS